MKGLQIFIIPFVYICTLHLGHAQVQFPLSSEHAVKEVFHRYRAPLLQAGIRSYGNVLAVMDATTVFVSDEVVELRTAQGLRITYVGIRPTVFIGQKLTAASVLGKSDDSTQWYLQIRDEANGMWMDPFRIFPYVFTSNRIAMRLIDFEFAYESDKQDQMPEKRVIQRRMHSGVFRAIVSVSIRDVYSQEELLPTYMLVRIGAQQFFFTQEELFMKAKSHDDSVRIVDNRVHLLLPAITLARGYYSASIAVHAPFSVHKVFSFSFFAD